MFRSDLEGLFERSAFEDVEACDRLLRLCHRAVVDHYLAVPHPDRLGVRDRLEDMTLEAYPAPFKIARPLLNCLWDRRFVFGIEVKV